MSPSLITHRGIDIPLESGAIASLQESRWSAFCAQMQSGFGLEFDIQALKGGHFAVSHDAHLGRISGGMLEVALAELDVRQFLALPIPNGRLCTLDQLLRLLTEQKDAMSALHLKRSCQRPDMLDRLLKSLEPFADKLHGRLLVFDALPEAAARMKAAIPRLDIAASVSHPYDIARYGGMTGGTLQSIEQVMQHCDLYSWVWLDEWDRVGPDGRAKSLINHKTVVQLASAGFKIAAVSPELHSTSPALLGGERHEDASNIGALTQRWREWFEFGVNAICTDHASWIANNLRTACVLSCSITHSATA